MDDAKKCLSYLIDNMTKSLVNQRLEKLKDNADIVVVWEEGKD